ncbi:hypothetical protein MBLNU230_g8101t1 [Neophaeotheca triangularis]
MATLTSLLPLILLLLFVSGAAFVGYQLYLWSNELADKGKAKMGEKHMSFTKDGGLRVGVKDMGAEEYADRTQNVLVDAWSKAEFPNYKSRLGWNQPQQRAK